LKSNHLEGTGFVLLKELVEVCGGDVTFGSSELVPASTALQQRDVIV
jgi:hypothetical protein